MAVRHGVREAIARAAAELATVPPFSELSPVDRARLAAALQEVSFEAGEVIYAQGARADALYILREGAVERRGNGVLLETLEPPAVFGDLGLLRDEVRATTLIAVSPARLWRLQGERFTRLAHRTPAIASFFAATMGGHLALRMQEVVQLSQEFQGMAQHLYSGLTRTQQDILGRAALLPELDPRVLESPPDALPLAHVLINKDDGDVRAYPPAFRRFVVAEMQRTLGPHHVADMRRELAARARKVGACTLAVQVLLEGQLVAEAVELADREVPGLLRTGHRDEARALVRLLPPESLRERPHLLELLAGVEPEDEVEESAPRRRWSFGRKATALVVGAVLLIGLWPLAPPEGLQAQGWHALVTLIASVPLLAVEALPDGIVALVIAAVWVVGGVTEPRTALGGFATPQWVLVVSTLAAGVAIASSGLLYRMALWVVANSRGGYAGQIVGLGVAGMVVGPAAPNATSRVALVAPAATELTEALGFKAGSREAVGLAMAMLIGFGQVAALFLTSSTTSVLVYAVLPETTRASVSWGSWVLRALPTHVILFGLLAAFIVWRYGPRGSTDVSSMGSLALQRALLGPPSRHERIAIAVSIFLLVGFSTQPLHHVDPAWIGVIALAILAGTGVLSAGGLGAVNWSFALLSGVLTSMSDVFSATQLDRWLAGIATQLVGGVASTPVLFVGALTLLCFALSLVVRWQAAAPLLTISLAPVGLSAGIDPWIIGMIALVACNGFFLPYQSTTYLALYHGTNGRLFSHSQARPVAVAYAATTLVALCASVPLWRAMGLL